MRKFYCCVGILCVMTLCLSAFAGTPTALKSTDAKVKAPASLNAEARPAVEFKGFRQGGDTCETATVIAGIPYTITGTTAEYTDDYDEACDWTATAPDVVYVFTPEADVIVDIDICESAYDTKLFVYENACTAGEAIACVDDSCSNTAGDNYRSNISGLALTAGNSYYIVVDGYQSNAGEYTLEVAEYAEPMGRCCAEDATCTETLESECVGTWTEGLDCTTPCPEPMDCMFGQRVFTPDESWTFGTIATEQGQIIYDNFWGMTAPVQDITIWALDLYHDGSAWVDCDYAGQLQVIIYEDNAGVPGAVVSDQTVNVTSVTATGDLYNGYESKEIVFSIAPVMQASGWISIQSVTDGCWLLWGGSPDGDGVCYSDDGTGLTAEDADRSICLAGEYVPEFGACCDDATGSCSDGVELIDCQGRFAADTLCADLDPQCGIPGACCDDLFGECLDDVNAIACPSPQRHAPGMTCAELDPQCGQATGACCNPDGTCEQTTEQDCMYNFLGILTDCSECPCVVGCPEGGIQELETCGDDTNGGCNADPYAAEAIAPGETVCGTVWSSTETRDTDWYEVTFETDVIVTITGEGDIPEANGGLLFGLVSGPCDSAAFVVSGVVDECTPTDLVTECIPAGTYWVFASVGDFLDNPCDLRYTLSLEAEVCVIPRGACCYGDAQCYEELTEEECVAANGREWHEGVACVDADCPPAAPGDNCANAFVVPDALPYTDTNSTTNGFLHDYDEVCPYEGSESPDVVYEYTPTIDRLINIDICESAYDTKLYVYEGTCPDAGNPLACVDDSCANSAGDNYRSNILSLPVIGGTTYYIVVDGYDGNGGDYIIEITEDLEAACCLSDGSCELMLEADCIAAGGREFFPGKLCEDVECPQPTLGENCSVPLPIELPAAGLPFVDTNTTCGMIDDYDDTGLGYYDGGEDTIYELTLTEAMAITIAIDPGDTAWTGVGLFAECPPGANAIATTTASSGAHTMECTALAAGTYYIMVDTWPSPDCIPTYTLTIDACTPPDGRCCYDGGYQCAYVNEAECDALGGAWDGELTCEDPCPIAPENDACEGAFEICCGTYKEGTTVGTLVDGGPDCTDTSDDTVETPDKEVWYTFIGTGQEMTVHTCGSSEDTIIAVYEGTCGELVCVAADDDSAYCDAKALQSSVTLCTEPLKRYYVAVWDYGANEPIDFMIGVDCGGLCTLGACCMQDGCEQTFEMECTGMFLGPNTDCADCPVFECEGTSEAEACGDDSNGGCNSDPFAAETAEVNATICGTSWAEDSTRDTDWYQITLTEDSIVELTFQAEFPVAVGFIGDLDGPVMAPIDCNNEDLQLNPYATAGWMEEGVVTSACLPAGDYVIFVGMSVYEGYPCDNGYSVEITATACTPRPSYIRPMGIGLFGGAVQQAVNGQFEVNDLNSTSNTPRNTFLQGTPGQIQIAR